MKLILNKSHYEAFVGYTAFLPVLTHIPALQMSMQSHAMAKKTVTKIEKYKRATIDMNPRYSTQK